MQLTNCVLCVICISLIGPQDPSWYRTLHNSPVQYLVNYALSLLFFSICSCTGFLRTLVAPSLHLYSPPACLSHFHVLKLAVSIHLCLLLCDWAGAPPLPRLRLAFLPLHLSLGWGGLPPPSSQLDVICVFRSVWQISCGSV